MRGFICLTLLSIILLFHHDIFCANYDKDNSLLQTNDTIIFQKNNSLNNCDDEKKIGFNLKVGRKFSEVTRDNKVDASFWFGFGVIYKISKYFSIGPEINFWNANERGYDLQYEINSREILFLVYFNESLGAHNFNILLGIGGMNINSRFNTGKNSESLLSINIGGGYGINIVNNLDCYLQFRRQLAGSLSPGGGSSYKSWLVGIIFQFKI